MNRIDVSFAQTGALVDHTELILESLFRLTGRQLVDSELSRDARSKALFEAPFAVLSHGTEPNPIFNYGNKAALKLYEMSWDDFTRMPSRFSAEQPKREERDRLLERVAECGFIDNYVAVRISSSGKRFLLKDAIVWNMTDDQGIYRGQAAVIYKWSTL